MKALFSISFLLFLFTACSDKSVNNEVVEIISDTSKELAIEDFEVLKNDLVLNQLEGKWYYNNKLFSGYSLKYYSGESLAEKIGFVEGKREGTAKYWSENGVLRIESFYKNNRLHNTYKSWWDNGVLSAQSNYVDGVKQGVEEEWYVTGQLAKQRQLVDGQEEGMQKAWLQNGKLYINYEAKNGRIFGMLRANSCYKLKDEVVSRDKTV